MARAPGRKASTLDDSMGSAWITAFKKSGEARPGESGLLAETNGAKGIDLERHAEAPMVRCRPQRTIARRITSTGRSASPRPSCTAKSLRGPRNGAAGDWKREQNVPSALAITEPI